MSNEIGKRYGRLVVIEKTDKRYHSTTIYYYSETEPTTSGYYWHYDTDGITPIVW